MNKVFKKNLNIAQNTEQNYKYIYEYANIYMNMQTISDTFSGDADGEVNGEIDRRQKRRGRHKTKRGGRLKRDEAETLTENRPFPGRISGLLIPGSTSNDRWRFPNRVSV